MHPSNKQHPAPYQQHQAGIYPHVPYLYHPPPVNHHPPTYHPHPYTVMHPPNVPTTAPSHQFQGAVMQRMQQARVRNQFLRKRMKEARLENARSILTQQSKQTISHLETFRDKLELQQQRQKEKALEAMLQDISNQTKAVASLIENQKLSTTTASVVAEAPERPVPPLQYHHRPAASHRSEQQVAKPTPAPHPVARSSSPAPAPTPQAASPSKHQPLASVPKEDSKPDITPRRAAAHVQKQLDEEFEQYDLDWTEEDQDLLNLDDLDDDEDEDGKAADASNTEEAEAEQEKQKQKAERAKKKLEIARQGSRDLLKPKWRLLAEESIDEDQLLARMMSPLQIFRSAALAIMFTIRLERDFVVKKTASRPDEQQHVANMLNLSFDSTKAWLAKAVRLPVLSILQEPKLKLDVVDAHDSKGFFGRFSSKNKAKAQKTLIKLRVRVKGIVDGIIKATEKQGIPPSMITFFARLTSDGTYFPDHYLFEEEKSVLEFDRFGATSNMNHIFEDETASGLDFATELHGANARGRMLLANFVLARILIAHLLYKPWENGIGAKPSQKLVPQNLKIIASLLYAILRKDFPLIEAGCKITKVVQRRKSSLLLDHKRKSVMVKSSSNSNISEKDDKGEPDTKGKDESNEEESKEEAKEVESLENNGEQQPVQEQEEAPHDTHFRAAREISSHLFGLDYFKDYYDDLRPFLNEQRTRVQEWLSEMMIKIHPPKEELTDAGANEKENVQETQAASPEAPVTPANK